MTNTFQGEDYKKVRKEIEKMVEEKKMEERAKVVHGDQAKSRRAAQAHNLGLYSSVNNQRLGADSS